MKKIISIILTLVLCIGFVPYNSVFAFDTSGTLGEFTWSFDGVSKLTVNGNGAMPDFDQSADDAWRNPIIREFAEELVITGNVTSIGKNAFRNFTGLKNLQMPDSVLTVDEFAFCNCVSLESIKFDGVTSIGYAAFYATGFKSITLPAELVSIGEKAFCLCESLEEITFNDKLKSIGTLAFESASALKEIRLGKGVETIDDYAFCRTGAKLISIPSSLKNIGYSIFADSWNITTVILDKDFTDLHSLDVLTSASAIKEIVVDPDSPAFCTVDGALYSKDKKKIVFYPRVSDSQTAKIADGTTIIGEWAFNECNALEKIEIPDSVVTIEQYAFSFCNSVKSFDIPDSVTVIEEGAFWGAQGLESFTVPKNVTKISEGMFSSCYALKEVNIHSEVTEIGNYAFSYCNSLKSVTIPESVTVMGERIFRDCTALESVEFKNTFDVLPGSTFSNCSRLATITLPEGVTTISKHAFYQCYALYSIYLPAEITGVENMAFDSCENLRKVYFAGTKEQWDSIDVGANNTYFTSATVTCDYVSSGESVKGNGDVNGDGYVDNTDAAIILKYDAGITNSINIEAADVNGDGCVDNADAARVLKYDAGIIDTL